LKHVTCRVRAKRGSTILSLLKRWVPPVFLSKKLFVFVV
jgi:hypothetical protein